MRTGLLLCVALSRERNLWEDEGAWKNALRTQLKGQEVSLADLLSCWSAAGKGKQSGRSTFRAHWLRSPPESKAK